MVNDGPESRWEAPIARPLYVTLRRAAALLDVPYWKMWNLSFCLEMRYFGDKGGAPRVLVSSIDEFIRLRNDGEDAQAVMASRKNSYDWSSSSYGTAWDPTRNDPRTRHWRKYWYYNR